jgi:dihydroneopterin aldolase / 2-amino-4-hydroxy-6-hydroxymethyldihydropteridine diphosphokinase
VAYNVFIGIGSNIGNRYSNCKSSVDQIMSDHRAEFSALSSFYRTSPVSPVAQEEFLNCVLKIRWHGSPLELLALLNRIETMIGRVRDVPQGPRTIDLDILLIDDLILETTELTVPHPRLHERKFTLVPILEIEPYAVHPLLGRPLKDFLEELGPEQVIEKWREGDSS